MRLPQLTPQSDSLFEAEAMRIRLARPSAFDGEREQQPRQEHATRAGLARKASIARAQWA